MRLVLLVTGVLLLATAIPSYAQAGGDLQVIADPGATVFVDGRSYGKTSAEAQGAFVEGLEAGHHVVVLKLQGFAPQAEEIDIIEGGLVELFFEFVKPVERIHRLPDEKHSQLVRQVGSLRLRAVPPRPKATVFLDGKQKGKGDLTLEGIPSGRHSVEWRRGRDRLGHSIVVIPGRTEILKADFRNRSVLDVGAQQRRREREKLAQEAISRAGEAKREAAEQARLRAWGNSCKATIYRGKLHRGTMDDTHPAHKRWMDLVNESWSIPDDHGGRRRVTVRIEVRWDKNRGWTSGYDHRYRVTLNVDGRETQKVIPWHQADYRACNRRSVTLNDIVVRVRIIGSCPSGDPEVEVLRTDCPR